ncbi:MAG TPA: hypothetical protein VM243_08410 [Phycisphaerae bacterium]|nr:hypothetical protein [Phycisphaerae bacterium]
MIFKYRLSIATDAVRAVLLAGGRRLPIAAPRRLRDRRSRYSKLERLLLENVLRRRGFYPGEHFYFAGADDQVDMPGQQLIEWAPQEVA